MLIYVCARLRIFSNSGAKIVKNSHIRKYSTENRLEKWILKARTAIFDKIKARSSLARLSLVARSRLVFHALHSPS